MKRILYIIVVLLSLSSCRKEQELIQPSNATLNFIYREASTKTLEVDEGWISNCNIFVYDQSGDLVESAYSGSGAIPSLSLNCRGDESYKFYCICNTGNITGIGLFSRETGLVNYQYSVSDYEDIIDVNGAVPMTGSTLPIRIADGMEIHINLTSCVALITIRVDDRGLAESTYEISSIRLKNSPKKVGLFSSSAAATASDCIATGDRAGYGDILRFNNGLGVGFYMFENAQGVLLPSNTDCHTKFFAAGSPYEDVCSYIELSGYYNGAWSANPAYGSFTYRFYLGSDPTSDFSVLRNHHYEIVLELTDEGINEKSWRVEEDLTPYAKSVVVTPANHIFNGITGICPMHATVLPSGSSQSITWSSSNPAVATVDQNGVVTPHGYGSAKIKATANDGSGRYGTGDVSVLTPSYPISMEPTLLAGTAGYLAQAAVQMTSV